MNSQDYFRLITDSNTRQELTGLGERNYRAELRAQLAALVAEAQISQPADGILPDQIWQSWTIDRQARYIRCAFGYAESDYQLFLISQINIDRDATM